MQLHEIVHFLEQLAPPSLQESYDNSGLIVGEYQKEITGILLTLDCTEEVVAEAVKRKCNLIVAHHPVVFNGIKRLNGNNYVERTVIKAIKSDVAIYAIHTNLDNVLQGVNGILAEKLGLINARVLSPKQGVLKKLVTFVPETHSEVVLNALFEAGAGKIGNYSECSFVSSGTGSYKANELANPFLGEKEVRHKEAELKIEVVFENYKEATVLNALRVSHPYEEVAFDVLNLSNTWKEIGAGLIGELEYEISEFDFLKHLKMVFGCGCIRYTSLTGKMVKKVAVCGGSGSFLLKPALKAGAQVFITGDVKYHEFFDAEKKILLADIGHYESEQFTKDLLFNQLSKKFSNFAIYLSEINTNPINYL